MWTERLINWQKSFFRISRCASEEAIGKNCREIPGDGRLMYPACCPRMECDDDQDSDLFEYGSNSLWTVNQTTSKHLHCSFSSHPHDISTFNPFASPSSYSFGRAKHDVINFDMDFCEIVTQKISPNQKSAK